MTVASPSYFYVVANECWIAFGVEIEFIQIPIRSVDFTQMDANNVFRHRIKFASAMATAASPR